MNEQALIEIRDLVQTDVNQRGLGSRPTCNLLTTTAADFAGACQSLAETTHLRVAIVTGFMIPKASPPRPETDGPLGAVFLARCLLGLGASAVLASDPMCVRALQAGLTACGCASSVPVVTLAQPVEKDAGAYWEAFAAETGPLTHLISVERVGPNHTLDSVRLQPGASSSAAELFDAEVPVARRDRCYTMRGRDVSEIMRPAHRLFEEAGRRGITTIGIGDGGNEIGMGKVSWLTIRDNIPMGNLIACRIPTDFLVVAGVSNWGAYGLAAGLRLLRGAGADRQLFDPGRERSILQAMIDEGSLVDGVTGQPSLSVDGLDFDRYAVPLVRLLR